LSLFPYVVHGRVRVNGILQENYPVKIRNETKNEEYTAYTTPEGEFAVSLSDVTKFPSRYSVGDTVKVTFVTHDITHQFTILEGEPGKEIDQNILIVADSASGIDNVPGPKVELSVSDVGSGIDSLAQEASLTIADTGNGVENVPAPEASIAVADSGSAAETVALQAALTPVQDSGVGQDNVQLQASITVADSGFSAEFVGVVSPANVLVVDSGIAAEVVAVDTEQYKTVLDSGSGVEQVQVSASLTVQDTAIGIETVGLEYSLTVQDSGAGSELVSVGIDIVYVDIADYGVGSEAVSTAAEVVVADVGTGVEFVAAGLVGLMLQMQLVLKPVYTMSVQVRGALILSFRLEVP